MTLSRELTKGFLAQNPVFMLLLGLCPTLAVTTSLTNAIGMGLAATFVLVCSNLTISIFKSFIPKEIRIPIFIVIIATFVTIVKLVMEAESPELTKALGIFLPLIVVNCVILGRAEAFASQNAPLPSVIDGFGMGLGFTGALALIGVTREILGEGKVLGRPLYDLQVIEPYTMKIMIIAPGGFLTMGLLLALFTYIGQEMTRREAIRKSHAVREGE